VSRVALTKNLLNPLSVAEIALNEREPGQAWEGRGFIKVCANNLPTFTLKEPDQMRSDEAFCSRHKCLSFSYHLFLRQDRSETTLYYSDTKKMSLRRRSGLAVIARRCICTLWNKTTTKKGSPLLTRIRYLIGPIGWSWASALLSSILLDTFSYMLQEDFRWNVPTPAPFQRVWVRTHPSLLSLLDDRGARDDLRPDRDISPKMEY
jgi:hypothetical protein